MNFKKQIFWFIFFIYIFNGFSNAQNVVTTDNINTTFAGNNIQKEPGPTSNFRQIYSTSFTGVPEGFTVVYKGRLFLYTSEEYLYSVDINSGRIMWNKKIEGFPASPPYFFGDFLYTVNNNKQIIKINIFNGLVVWEKSFEIQITGCYALYNENLFCLGDDKKLYRINEKFQEANFNQNINLDPSTYAVYQDNILYLPGKNNALVSYDLRDMRVRYRFATETDIITPVLIGPELIYFTDRNKLYAINKITGRAVWIRRINMKWFNDLAPVLKYYDNKIFLNNRGYDYKTGMGNWVVFGKGDKLTDNFIAGKYFYYAGEAFPQQNNNLGFIEVWDIQKREKIYYFNIKSIPKSSLTVFGKIIFFIDADGLLHGFTGV